MTPPRGTLTPFDAGPATGSASARADRGGDAATPAGAAGAAAAPAVPERTEGLELLGRVSGSGYEQQPSLVRRGDGQTLQMTPLLYSVLEAIDGRRDHAQIADVVSARIGKIAEADDVEYLIDNKLRPLGVLRQHDGSQPQVAKANPLLALRWRFVVSNPRVTRRITAPFAQLFHPIIAIPMLLAFAGISAWVLLEKGLGSATQQALYEPGLLLAVFALTMVSAGFHEFGHAAACRYGGATPGAMGAGLYLVWPAFYTDVTDSYRLGRWGRVRVDVGGLYFNAIFAVGMLGVWLLTGRDAILLLIPAQLLQMLRQLLPFVRFDGYHILADLTGVPDLFAHIKPTLLGLLPSRWRSRRDERQPLKRWARVVVTVWVLTVIPVLAFSLFMMVKLFPRIAATAWDSLGVQYSVLLDNWFANQYADVGVRILSMFTIALPLASIAYLLSRIAYRTVRRVWRATEGKPRLRALAAVAGAAIIAFVAWAWWPEGQYQPIQDHEKGTLVDALVPLVQQAQPQQALALAQLGMPQAVLGGAPQLAAPAPGFYQISGPAQLPPPGVPAGVEAEPRLGIVLTPADDEDSESAPVEDEPIVLLAPESTTDPEQLAEQVPEQVEVPADTPMPMESGVGATEQPQPQPEPSPGRLIAEQGEWVFPFNPPREAREHDNQALAVNTTDGGTLYDVSFAWVWVVEPGKEHVDHRNDAYAFASCENCTTVAIAFEIIFIVGQANVIVPQNVAMAVNYECVECTTYALAVQLIATLTDLPSSAAMAELEEIWDFAQLLEANVMDLPVEQVYAYLKAIEGAMLQVLVNDDGASAEAASQEAIDGEAPDALMPTESPSATASPSASASPGASPYPSPYPTEAPWASPSSSPSTSPSSSPSPSSSTTTAPSSQTTTTTSPSSDPSPSSAESTSTESSSTPSESSTASSESQSEAPASSEPEPTQAPATESTTTTESSGTVATEAPSTATEPAPVATSTE